MFCTDNAVVSMKQRRCFCCPAPYLFSCEPGRESCSRGSCRNTDGRHLADGAAGSRRVQKYCCPVKITAVSLLPLKRWVFQQILIVCGLGSAPTGQEALSPGHRPGVEVRGQIRPDGAKAQSYECFCPVRAPFIACDYPGRCPGLSAHWPFRPNFSGQQ